MLVAAPTPTPTGPTPTGGTHDPWVLFVNRDRVTLTAGTDDAGRNRSSLVRDAGLTSVTLPASTRDDAYWRKLMTCVGGKFADFDVIVTTTRPKHGPYIMVKVGGHPKQLGRPIGKIGLAKVGGPTKRQAVALAFEPGNVSLPTQCTTVAHEVGHVLGLAHSSQPVDIMGQGFPTQQEFLNRDEPCGSADLPTACRHGKATQNSYQHIVDLIGLRPGVKPQSPTRPLPPPPKPLVTPPKSRPLITVHKNAPGIDAAGRGARVPSGGPWNPTVDVADPDGVKSLTVTFESPSGRVSLECGQPDVTDASCVRTGDSFELRVNLAAKRQFVAFRAVDDLGNAYGYHMVTEVGD